MYFGIDLGTTYSCIACVKGEGEATVLSNSDSEQTTPSVVYFENADNVAVGTPAKEELRAGSDQAIARAKHFMGTDKSFKGYRPEALSPQEISAYVLRKLVQDAKAQVDGDVSDVVITCPAYFGLDAIAATKQAGELAGLKVHYVIPEPVAAAYYYATTREIEETRTLLVYDLGGGTFDVTVAKADSTEIRVVCIDGDRSLGGDDWDGAVATHLAERLASECGKDLGEIEQHDETMQVLLGSAEAAKRQLSSKETAKVRVLSELGQMRIDFSRQEFDDRTQGLLGKTLKRTRAVVENARQKHGVTNIDEVLLVGGSTFMPQVEAGLRATLADIGLGNVPIRRADPHLAVAKGAAWYAHKCAIDGEVKQKIAEATGQQAAEIQIGDVAADVRGEAERNVAGARGIRLSEVTKLTEQRIRNVTPKTFGVKILARDGRNHEIANLIMKDTEAPHEGLDTVYTVVEGQTAVLLPCMQSTSEEKECPVDEGEEIGTPIKVEFGRSLPKESPVDVRFQLSADGLLSVVATERSTGTVGRGEIRTSLIQSEGELAKRKAVTESITIG
jgi:molecular chaperone DnaK (HSP70)